MTVSGFTIHFVSHFVTMLSSKKRKISSKTLKEKYEVIKKLESGCANKNIAADYDVYPSTLSTWLKSKDKIVKAFKGGTSSKTQKLKPCGNENLERALYTWFVQMRGQGVPISGPVLREKALSYAKEISLLPTAGSIDGRVAMGLPLRHADSFLERFHPSNASLKLRLS